MTFGAQLLAWRRHRRLTQSELGSNAGIPRPYLSRLELDKADPSLSLVRRLAVALDLGVGELIERPTSQQQFTNDELDRVARGALRPGLYDAGKATPYIRPMSRLLKERRASLGLTRSRGSSSPTKIAGIHALRRIR